jgi:Tol biopolymer transport system component
MTLQIGQQLGSLEITALLGKGGMGEVYRARDTKLKRDVAVKILPAEFASDIDRVNRFQREAEVLASLSHQNIAGIYDLQQAGGTRLLVMELVDGETLADRIKHGPLPVEEALQIGKSICEALEAAHEKGIVHRDLKPANVKITSGGMVKVLDFGLAKIAQSQTQSTLSNSPTLMSGSMPGMLMGTTAYMSPEQAKGKQADRGSDVWAFGCVLYELLTGRSAFVGDTIAEIFGGVLHAEPDWNLLPAETPTAIRRLLRRCLQKNRAFRLHDIGDARIEIEEARMEQGLAAAGVSAHTNTAPAYWIITVLLALGALGLAVVHFRETAPLFQGLQYTMALPENGALQGFAISPNGRMLALALTVRGKRQLWLRPLDSLQAQPMPGTEDGSFPFWSPDSRYIAFFAGGKLKKIAISGGPPQSLCDADGRGGSWSSKGIILFSNGGFAIRRISPEGGLPVDVIRAGDSRFPVFLPDGNHFLYSSAGGADKSGIHLSSISGDDRRIVADANGVVFAPAVAGRVSHLLFVRDSTLLAQPFDSAKFEISGEAFPVAESVSSFTSSGVNYIPVAVSDNGILLFGGGDSSQIVWFDRAGNTLPASLGGSGACCEPAISPDGKALAFRRQTGGTIDIWLRDLGRSVDTRLTTNGATNLDPFWSPKGDRILFNSSRGGVFDLYEKAIDGSGQDESVVSNSNIKLPDQWTRDGRFIVYSELDPRTKWDLWALPMQGDTKERHAFPLLHSEFNELYGQISPDGRLLAYTSDESGRREVYLRRYPEADGQIRISVGGGEQPRWRGDGKELFFVTTEGTLTAVNIKSVLSSSNTQVKTLVEPGTPVQLFETRIGEGSGHVAFQYDVTADGERFAIATTSSTESTSLTVMVNWTEATKH